MADEPQSAPDTPPTPVLTEGILLALISAAAYAVAFLYETGYADCYGYPHWLIEIGLSNVVLAWTSISFALLLFLLLYSLVGIIVPAEPLKLIFLSRAPIMLLAPLMIIYVAFFESHMPWQAQLVMFAFSALLLPWLLLLWIRGFLRADREWTLPERIAFAHMHLTGAPNSSPQQEADVEKSLLGKTVALPGLRLLYGYSLLFVIVSAALVLFANSFGAYRAGRQRTFLVSSDHPPLVALRRYGENVIATPSALPSSSTGTRPVQVIPWQSDSRSWTLRTVSGSVSQRLACR